MAEFMAALRAEKVLTAYALEFLILTATRTGEALGASWDTFHHDFRFIDYLVVAVVVLLAVLLVVRLRRRSPDTIHRS